MQQHISDDSDPQRPSDIRPYLHSITAVQRQYGIMTMGDVNTYSSCAIVTSTNGDIAGDVQTPHTVCMTGENMQTFALLDVPYSQCGISRTRNGDRTAVEYFETSDGGGVALE